MTSDGTQQAHRDPKGELAEVIAQLGERGITLSLSDSGMILVHGYDKDNPDHAGILVANRELINRHLVPQGIGDGVGLEPGFNPHSARSAARNRRPLRPTLTPAELEAQRAAQKQARRRSLRLTLAASRVPLTGPPVEVPDSGAGVVTGPAELPPYQVQAQARAYRDAHRGMGGRRTIPIYQLQDPL